MTQASVLSAFWGYFQENKPERENHFLRGKSIPSPQAMQKLRLIIANIFSLKLKLLAKSAAFPRALGAFLASDVLSLQLNLCPTAKRFYT
ncbi:hypothetical protein [Rufibacter ruber]|uniref:hypothetical protein n=1 Tax=Rufibacter ruber TaxID=1783499 RepID=UPI00137AE120|nr:hypothetical protein [Rufibacter ruber]